MINGKKVLGIIPARGGSKRLPRKNVLSLNGKPMIAWTIDAALNSKYIDKVIVSTDDDEISNISKEYGAEIPFSRPDCLASDTATSNDVIMHAINSIDYRADIVVILQPTSPLRKTEHIDDCLNSLVEKKADGIVSVTPCEHSPLWANVLPDDGCMDRFLTTNALKRSQDLQEFYRLNGAIYCFTSNSINLNGGVAYSKNVFSYIIPSEFSVDIDTKIDFMLAESIIEAGILKA